MEASIVDWNLHLHIIVQITVTQCQKSHKQITLKWFTSGQWCGLGQFRPASLPLLFSNMALIAHSSIWNMEHGTWPCLGCTNTWPSCTANCFLSAVNSTHSTAQAPAQDVLTPLCLKQSFETLLTARECKQLWNVSKIVCWIPNCSPYKVCFCPKHRVPHAQEQGLFSADIHQDQR